eukprot:2515222-Pleurochrysis_carterae.AAC.2
MRLCSNPKFQRKADEIGLKVVCTAIVEPGVADFEQCTNRTCTDRNEECGEHRQIQVSLSRSDYIFIIVAFRTELVLADCLVTVCHVLNVNNEAYSWTHWHCLLYPTLLISPVVPARWLVRGQFAIQTHQTSRSTQAPAWQ